MISEDTTSQIAELINGQLPMDEEVVKGLRNAFPEMHFTYCFEDDIHSGTPVVDTQVFSLYLVDGREHCLCLTSDRDIATGVVIAEKVAD